MRLFFVYAPIGRRLLAMMGLAGAVSFLLAAMGIMGLAASNDSLHSVYEDRMVPVRDLSRIQSLILSNRLSLQFALVIPNGPNGAHAAPMQGIDPGTAQASVRTVQRNLQTVDHLWQSFTSRALTPQEDLLAKRVERTRQHYLQEALYPTMAALQNLDYAKAQQGTRIGASYFASLEPQLEALITLEFELANAAYQSGLRRYETTRGLALLALLGSMAMMSWLGWRLVRSIQQPLDRVIDVFRQISMGHFDTPIHARGNDEISRMMRALGHLQTKLGADEAAIHQLAFYDPLTHLPNRRLLRDRLQLALDTCVRSGLHGAVMMIDLDDFKSINDTQGHKVGDDLLVEMAQRIKACVRQADTVARLGGDEFVVMLVNLSLDANQAALLAEGIAEKILQTITQPCAVVQPPRCISASVGLCLFPDDQATMDDLLKRADLAMYQAKHSGRNTQRFFDPQIQADLEERLALEQELRQALVQHQFELYYQAQVDGAGQVLGAEVLLRWNHLVRGLVQPMDFIPVAEASGLIVPIGEWVLRSACAQLKQWEIDPQTEPYTLSVNVSARQFRQADFVPMVLQVLDQTAINPKRLKLELTESLVLDNVPDTVLKMKQLNQRGIQFSLDDFGTGYSSLSQLSQLPIWQLKIDRSFVNQIACNFSDAVIVQTIIGMSSTLGLQVIAEGVETEQQRALLDRLGCPVYQGYLAGRPMPLEEFLKHSRPCASARFAHHPKGDLECNNLPFQPGSSC